MSPPSWPCPLPPAPSHPSRLTQSTRLSYRCHTAARHLLSTLLMYVFSWDSPSICPTLLVAQRLKCLPAMWETRVRSLGQEHPPWGRKIPWRRKWQPIPVLLPGESHRGRSLVGYSLWGRWVGHDWATSLHSFPHCVHKSALYICISIRKFWFFVKNIRKRGCRNVKNRGRYIKTFHPCLS